MYKLPIEQHAAIVSAIDRKQWQNKPLLSKLVFKSANNGNFMLQNTGSLKGVKVSYVCVKQNENWTLYYLFGDRSPMYIKIHGKMAKINQVHELIEAEGDLMKLYRR